MSDLTLFDEAECIGDDEPQEFVQFDADGPGYRGATYRFRGVPVWLSHWMPCDQGQAYYWRCARDHGVDAACSLVYRMCHPVHRRDLPTCFAWPCNGGRCTQRYPVRLVWTGRDSRGETGA